MTELLLGFIIGLRHALDADHVSAVATLVSRQSDSLQQTIKIGISWGIGHTLTLLAVSLIILLNGGVIAARFASALEWMVGIMLMVLGFDLLRRLRKDGIHAHAHQHQDGQLHLHAHRHEQQKPEVINQQQKHHHHHPKPPSQKRALLVGIMHGMAGSAALTLIVLSSAPSLWSGLGYVLLFGLGTLIGMASLSVVIALPLRFSATRYEKFYGRLQQSIALVSIGLGTMVIVEHSHWLVG